MRITAQQLYKEDTGFYPFEEVELEFELWRSRGQWIFNISDEEKIGLWGNMSEITIKKPDEDYVRWLENKVEELMSR